MDTRVSLLLRSVLAVVLFVGFYLLALGVAALLVALPLLEIVVAEQIHLKLALLCGIGAVVIVWSILPRFDRFEAPGPRLEEGDHPRLFSEIRSIAQATGQGMPAEVYLVPDINAWVAQRGGIMGLGSRRVMGLGLPLMQVLTVSELRAVLAHEFGHYHGGDTALGPWIWRTRAAIGRTIGNLGSTGSALLVIVQVPFSLYGKLFLRITLAVSRAQEYAADRLAAQVEGARALASGLRKVHAAAHAFDPYFRNEYVPVLSAGYRPPLAAGFGAFVASPVIAPKLADLVDDEIKTGKGDPYDSHPPLGARLAALEGLGAARDEADTRPGTALLDHVTDAEKELFAQVLPAAAGLAPVPWEDVPDKVMAPNWRDHQAKIGPALAGKTVGTVPVDATSLAGLGRTLLGERASRATEREIANAGASGIEGVIGLALTARGWRAVAPPGDFLRFERDGKVLSPWRTVQEVLDGKKDTAAWAQEAAAAGVADVPLGQTPGVAPDQMQS